MKSRILVCVSAFFFLLLMLGCGGSSHSSSTTVTTGGTAAGSGTSGAPGSAPPSTPGSGGASGTGSGSSGAGGSSGSGSSGGGNAQGAVSFAYVGTAGSSTAGIYGFSIAPNGTATSVPGSPVAGPSGFVVTNSAFVFGTDSNNIASYARSGDGSLKQVASALAVGSNGSELWAIGAMNLDHTGQTLYAAEDAGSDDNFYVFFSVAANGSITKIGQIGPSVDYISPLVFSPDNQFAYGFGCFHLGWDVTSFHRNSDGSLTTFDSTANSQAPPEYLGSGQMYCPEGEAISQMGYMALADTAANTNTTGVGVYKINADGTLTFMQNSTLETQLPEGSNGCCFPVAMNFDRTGRFLALAGSGGIQIFQLMPGGTLAPIGGLQAPGPTYVAVQWDVDNHLYAVSSSGLYVFTSAQGVLTPTSDSPHAAGAAASLTVLPTH